MTQERELEAKILLPENIFHRIISNFENKRSFNQTNYYFDTNDHLLKSKNISCRVRIFDDYAEQTLKVPDPDPVKSTFHDTIEITDKLTLSAAHKLIELASGNPYTFTNSVGNY